MKRLSAIALVLFAAFAAVPERAAAQSACEIYVVQRGDTLNKIAKAAYGFDNFRAIWRANRAVIGRNPNIIEIGMELLMPCPEGVEANSASASQLGNTAVSLITANGYGGYTDEGLTQGGMISTLVQTALTRGAPEVTGEVVFIDDRDAHLEHLLPRQAFDASFPWVAPNCGDGSEACGDLVFSDPVYQIVEGFFSSAGKGFEAETGYLGFAGASICRPKGYSTAHLEAAGLVAPIVTLVQPATAATCFEMLKHGSVDLVAFDTRAGDWIIAKHGMQHDVVENPHLVHIDALRVAVHTSNPKGTALIEDLNRGLAQMLASGEWASLVSAGLSAAPPALVN